MSKGSVDNLFPPLSFSSPSFSHMDIFSIDLLLAFPCHVFPLITLLVFLIAKCLICLRPIPIIQA